MEIYVVDEFGKFERNLLCLKSASLLIVIGRTENLIKLFRKIQAKLFDEKY